ncbi:hypothetical protein DWW90_08725 [Parabacteroides sp. AF17-28]|nr:hypothetical protein DWW90_08725 [Parabacteroides sp. AF17-28]
MLFFERFLPLLKTDNLFWRPLQIWNFCIENVAKKLFFGDKMKVKMVLQSIENKMISVISRKKNGTILFASDFADMGERKAINKAFALQILR